jgi:hypothetical protein
MIQKAKKKTSFFLGILVTGILGTIGGYVNSNYSKDSSFLIPVAKADVPFGSSSLDGNALVDAGSGCDGGSGGSGDGGGSGGDCG